MTTKSRESSEERPKMNVKLLRRIQKHILAEPRRYNQNAWVLKGKDAILGNSVLHSADADVPKCKTVGCIAGWACVLGNKRVRNYRFSETAAKLLSLSDDQAQRLFSGIGDIDETQWPARFNIAYEKAKSYAARARVAAKRIDHFIKTKGAE